MNSIFVKVADDTIRSQGYLQRRCQEHPKEPKWWFSKDMATLKKFLKNRPSGPILSISQNVHMFVCVCVCLCVDFLRYRFNVFLSPIPEVRCPIFLEIRNPWGKVMEISGLRFEHFSLEVVKICFCWFCLTKHGGNHASRWNRDL